MLFRKHMTKSPNSTPQTKIWETMRQIFKILEESLTKCGANMIQKILRVPWTIYFKQPKIKWKMITIRMFLLGSDKWYVNLNKACTDPTPDTKMPSFSQIWLMSRSFRNIFLLPKSPLISVSFHLPTTIWQMKSRLLTKEESKSESWQTMKPWKAKEQMRKGCHKQVFQSDVTVKLCTICTTSLWLLTPSS
jgi:hypothetical protein